MSEFDQLYREVILDHYKNPRGHGLIEHADAQAEGQNPLCGDEVTISVRFAEDGETIEDDRLRGPRVRDLAGGDVDAHRAGQGPEGGRRRRAAEGGAARRDRDPADADPAQVRDPRPRRAQGGAAPGEGDAAPRGVARALRRACSSTRRDRARGPRRAARRVRPGLGEDRHASAGRRSASTTAAASSTRSRTAARTTTARCARASGRRTLPRDLPAPRLGVRPRDAGGRSRCRRSSRSRRTRSSSRTESSRSSSRTSSPDPLLGDDRPALPRLPRRGVGPAGARRARPLRAALPRGLPVGALVADDPAQARGVPRRVRAGSTRSGSPAFGERDVARLLGDASIVRHRGQDRGDDRERAGDGRAARGGHAAARALLGVRSPACRTRRGTHADWAASTPESAALSKRLRARGLPLRRPDDRATPRCRRAASSTTTSRAAGCAPRSRRSGRSVLTDPLW